MTDENEVLGMLRKIHDLLVPISVCFEEQYKEIQRQQLGAKLEELKSLLTTPKRRKIFPYLFDSRCLSQVEIAEEAGATQATVSRFISVLLERGFIEQARDETGAVTYVDKFNLSKLVEVSDEWDG